MNNLNTFYLKQEEPNKSCFLILRQIILDQDEHISETRKYGMPCFTYNKKLLCYLWKDKKTHYPYILMVDGNLIEHPNLETGARKRMKILPINPNEDIPIDSAKEVLDLGLNLHR